MIPESLPKRMCPNVFFDPYRSGCVINDFVGLLSLQSLPVFPGQKLGISQCYLHSVVLEWSLEDRVIVENALPNFEKATIDPKKLTEYALNPEHPVGGNKAKVFESVLGYNKSNWEQLAQQVQEKLPQSEAISKGSNGFGELYQVDMNITGSTGRSALVRTGWIVKLDGPPSLSQLSESV